MIELFDIHTHILPGVDDGAENMEQALRMLDAAYKDGTRGIIFTPHYKFDDNKYGIDKIRAAFDEFYDKCCDRYPDLTLLLGCEAYGEIELPQKLDDGKVLTMADTRYVLVEYHPSIEYSHVSRNLNDLIRYGYRPIIAHAERYQCFRKSLDRLRELIYMGALVQVNANGVIGKRGLSTKWFLSKLLKQRLVHFIASDSHDEAHRPVLLASCAKYVENKFGFDYMSELFVENAMRLINNEPI